MTIKKQEYLIGYSISRDPILCIHYINQKTNQNEKQIQKRSISNLNRKCRKL